MNEKTMANQSAQPGDDAHDPPMTLESCLSELRRAEETIAYQQRQLFQLETRYNTLFDSLDEGFCIIEVLFDANGQPRDYRFLKVNGAFEEQTGIRNPLGRTILEAVPDHERDWFEIYGQIALTGEAQRFEQRAAALDRFYDVFAFRIGNPKDAQVAILFKDIAERRRREEALRESEENYRVIVNQSIAGILKVDLQGNIIFSNEQFCRALGYELPELLSLGINDIVYPDDHERNRTAFARLASAGEAYEIEKRLVRKDGEVVWVNNHVSPIFDKEGLVVAATVVSIDISRQKALERQKDEFISIASHELKTPLTSIKVYGEILAGLMDPSVPPPIAQLITKMNVQVNRLVKLIYSLLNTSRIAGGELTLQVEPIDLNLLLEEHVLQGQLTTSKHRIVFDGAELPLVAVDVERLGQVMDNLISNAIKYAPDGGDVIVRAESNGDHVRVSVRDFGVGMPKGVQDKIFDRFYRVKGATTEAVSGIGLGLYICREIIGKHQGTMGVESVLGEGSTFYFELPVYTADS